MSEKTLGEVARAAYFKGHINVVSWKEESSHYRQRWQAAADAIAAPLLARIAELEGEVGKAQEASAHLKSDLLLSRKGFEAVDEMRVEALEEAETAYQRGVADGLERARNLMEANGMEWAAGKIAEAIRSASPAEEPKP